MKIYVFGNKDHDKDKMAFVVAKKLQEKIKNIEFVEVKPNEDLSFENNEDVIIMDGVWGIKDVKLITNIDKFDLGPKNSVHDFDLSFQLKYLRKIGKLKNIKIIGLPLEGKVEMEKVKEIIIKNN